MRRLKLISVLFFSSIILSACSNPFDQLADEINGWLGSESANTSEESNDSGKMTIPTAITKQTMIPPVTLRKLKLWTTVT